MSKLLNKTVVITSGLLLIFIAGVSNFDLYKLCGSLERFCEDLTLNLIVTSVFFWSIPILVFASACYFLRKEIFSIWFKFTMWWILISTLVVYIVPGKRGGSIFSVEGDKVVFLFSLVLFIFISLILIITKQLKYWREGKIEVK